MLTITKDLREWLPDDVIGAVMEVQVYTATVYVYIFIITKDLREWLYIYNNDDVIGAVMEVQVQTIVFVAVTVYVRTLWGDHKREKAC